MSSSIKFGDDMRSVLDIQTEEDYVILSTDDTIEWSTYKKGLESLQRLDATFLEPADSPEFEAWLEVIEPMSAGNGILLPHNADRKLEANPILESQYIKFVPGVLSYQDFWERYLFRVTLLEHRLGALSRNPPVELTISDPVVAQLPLLKPIEQSIKTWVKEHIADMKHTRSTKSAISEHTLDKPNHYIRFDNPQILAKENRFIPRMMREAIEIKKHPNFNREDGWQVPPVWDPIIKTIKTQTQQKPAARPQDTVSSFCVQRNTNQPD